MPTVIDELIVRLSLDPKDFQKGQKEAAASFLKTKEAATKTGKDIEDGAKKTAAGVEKMTRTVIALFGAIAGARSLTDLVTGLTQANAELGRFSANVGLSPQRVAAWGAAVQRVGGDAGQAQGTIAKLTSTFTAFKNGMGNLPDEFWFLRQRSGVNINPLGSTEESLSGIAEAIQKLSKTDRKSAFNFAQGLGIDASTFEVMRQQGAGINKYLADLEKFGPSDKAVENATKLQEAWGKLVQTLGAIAQKFTEVVSPHLTALIESLTKLFERLANNVNWDAIGKGMAQFASVAGDLTKGMDGATAAVTAFLAIWTGAQFAKALANMLLLRGLGGGAAAGAAGGGSGLLGFLGVAGAAAAGAWSLANPGDGLKNAPRKYGAWGVDDVIRRLLGTDGSAPSSPTAQVDVPLTAAQMASRSQMKGQGDIRVDGRPASKGNPLPVTISDSNSGSGGGFWSSVGSAISSFFAPAANASTGGGSSGSSGSSSGGGPVAVPNIAGMTDQERNTLGLILKHESGGRNVMNYMGAGQGLDPTTAKGYTAQGYYQILNSNWRRLAPKLGITSKNALASSLEDQTKVALALMRESGVGNWANFNPSLRQALARGDKAGSWGEMVKAPSGAEVSALNNSISNDNRRSSSNVDTRIGSVNLYTQATDSKSIADHLWDDLYRRIGQSSTAAAANSGPQ